MQLVIGTKRWSSWSMRPWLALKHAGVPFEEVLVELRQENNVSGEAIRAHSPSGLVPALKDGDLLVCDSLAICEYVAERYPDLWPSDPAARAQARAAASEMHSGFGGLRSECPMALEAEPTQVELSAAAAKDVRRIVTLWREMLDRWGGPFLAGRWSIADAFYTPVATRLRTYGVRLAEHGDDGTAEAYAGRLLETPEFKVWELEA